MRNIMFVFLFFVFCSCSGVSSSFLKVDTDSIAKKNIPIIKPEFEGKRLSISDYLKSVRYVKLELSDESLIGEITKLEVFENRIYVHDLKTKSVFVFSIDGRYLFKINNVGQGPGEYLQVNFFGIDRDRKEMVLSDFVSMKILRYDLSGKYLSTQKVPFRGYGIHPIHDDKIAFYSAYRKTEKFKKEHLLYYIDSKNNIEKAYFPYVNEDDVDFISTQSGPFYSNGNDYNYFDRYSDMVYLIGKDGLVPKYKFDFGDKVFDISYMERPSNELKEYLQKEEFPILYFVAENDNLLVFNAGHNYKTCLGYYFKKTGEVLNAGSYKDGDNSFGGMPIAAYDTFVIGVYDIAIMMSEKDKMNKDQIKEGKFVKEKIAFLETITDEDNPALIFYELDNK